MVPQSILPQRRSGVPKLTLRLIAAQAFLANKSYLKLVTSLDITYSLLSWLTEEPMSVMSL